MVETIRIHKTSPLTQKPGYMDLPITHEQLVGWMNGELIQVIMPELNADQREFLISGYMPGEFDLIFKEDEDE